MKNFPIQRLLLVLLILVPGLALGINTKDTRMLTQPAISENHIAFIYAEDLWIANADGSNPVRLTVDEGVESNPFFSPDGKLIAFSAEYDGNTDVFVVPVEGGIPQRLTWHPSSDYVKGFTPDGKSVLFISQRFVYTGRYFHLYTVPVEGGFPTQLEIPNAYHANYSPNGDYMAYTPIPDAFRQWKNYRGGTISTIWLFSFADHSITEIPKPEGGCNDINPVWHNDMVYFLSDRNGEFNIFSYSKQSNEVKQVTNYTDFPIISMSNVGNQIIFEQAGYLHKYKIGSASPEKVNVGIATDLQELRPRFVSDHSYIRSADISATGARAVFDYRGEIITVPAEKGDPRNITETTGAHEKYPAWSPDGKWIAYFSDESGEYKLVVKQQDGKGTPKVFNLNGAGFYAYPKWSPDSKKIAYVDNSRSLFVIDTESGAIKKISSDMLYSPGVFRDIFGSWSFDSKWISYTKVLETNFKMVYLYSIDQDKSFPVTDGLSDASEPIFDPSGKYLYFFASTDAGPVVNWFDLSNADMRMSKAIYLLTLQKETISPFAKESDEEEVKEKVKDENADNGKSKKDKKDKSDEKTDVKTLTIDFEGIENRIIDIPVKAGNFSNLGAAKEGEILYIEREYNSRKPGNLHKYAIKKQKDSRN